MFRNNRKRMSYEDNRKRERNQMIHGVIFFLVMISAVIVMVIYTFE